MNNPLKKILWLLVLFGSCAQLAYAQNKSQLIADVIYINGDFYTLDPKKPKATAVAIKDGRFVAIGSANEVNRYAGSKTSTIDLGGKFVLPGFVDGHTHPVETIWLKNDWVDARYPGTPSVKQALINIAERIKITPKDQWVYVAGVSASENKFLEKRVPTRAELDAVAPNNPVIMANGAHMAIANSAALKQLGVKKGVTKLPNGGTLLVDANGEPNGVITDGMGDIPGSPAPEEIVKFYQTEIPKFWNQYGFTSMMAITQAGVLPLLHKAASSPAAPNMRYSVSIWAAPNGDGIPNDLKKYAMPANANSDFYRFVGIKAWIDGENDCRTGFMYEKYLGKQDIDPPGGHGHLVTPQAKANQIANIAKKNNKISMLHCSGDAAVDIGLKAYEQSLKTSARPIQRIEHFGVFQLNNSQLERAKKLKKNNFHFSVQPIWLLELVKADYENMGVERSKTGFKFHTMIQSGLEPAASTDMTGIYLENINPFKGMYAAVTRQSDVGLFEPQEAISVEDALKMWTIWPARAMGEGDEKGTITVGKFGDLTVLSQNIFTIPKEQIKDLHVEQTIVGGKVAYKK